MALAGPTGQHLEAAPPGADGPSEWLTWYSEELGHPPACAEHLQAFVARRGGRLAYRAAQHAVAQAAGRASGRRARRGSPPRTPGLRHQDRNIQNDDATAFGHMGLNPQPVQTADWISNVDHEAMLRDFLPAFHDEARVNPEAAIRRLLLAVEHEARLVADVESTRILAALTRVDGPGTCRECAICLDTDNGGEALWVKLPCGHMYHESCLGNWFRQSNHGCTCPLCRIDVETAMDSTSSSAELREL